MRKIRETLPYIIVTSNIKYLGVTLPKHVKDLYAKNFKTLLYGYWHKIQDLTLTREAHYGLTELFHHLTVNVF